MFHPDIVSSIKNWWSAAQKMQNQTARISKVAVHRCPTPLTAAARLARPLRGSLCTRTLPPLRPSQKEYMHILLLVFRLLVPNQKTSEVVELVEASALTIATVARPRARVACTRAGQGSVPRRRVSPHALAQKDWESDNKGRDAMSQGTFHHALFELVDHWTEGHDIEE